jgi:hypothetical protein
MRTQSLTAASFRPLPVDFPDEFDASMVLDLPLDYCVNLTKLEIRAVSVRVCAEFLQHLYELLQWLPVCSWPGA